VGPTDVQEPRTKKGKEKGGSQKSLRKLWDPVAGTSIMIFVHNHYYIFHIFYFFDKSFITVDNSKTSTEFPFSSSFHG
jgi:hypothetical protein